MNEQKVLILSNSPYDFKNDAGENIVGSTLWLVPLNHADEYTNGIKPVKYSLSHLKDVFDNVQLPANATMIFDFDFSRGKVTPVDFVDFKPVEL